MKIYSIEVLNLVDDTEPLRTLKADGFEWTGESNRIQFYRYDTNNDSNSKSDSGKYYVASYPANRINIKEVRNLKS